MVFAEAPFDVFECFAVDVIDFIILEQDLFCQIYLLANEGIDRASEHPLDASGHAVNIERHGKGGVFTEEADALGDAGGEIADSFEVVINFENGDDEAEVIRDGLMKGEDFLAFLFDAHFGFINKFVGFYDLFCEIRIVRINGFNGAVQVLLDQPAEGEEVSIQVVDFTNEELSHGSSKAVMVFD